MQCPCGGEHAAVRDGLYGCLPELHLAGVALPAQGEECGSRGVYGVQRPEEGEPAGVYVGISGLIAFRKPLPGMQSAADGEPSEAADGDAVSVFGLRDAHRGGPLGMRNGVWRSILRVHIAALDQPADVHVDWRRSFQRLQQPRQRQRTALHNGGGRSLFGLQHAHRGGFGVMQRGVSNGFRGLHFLAGDRLPPMHPGGI